MLARRGDIAIVGGGIVGASCAYFLAERGDGLQDARDSRLQFGDR